MAYEERVVCITVPASGDLSSYQFYLGEIDSAGRVAVCNSQGERAFGVIYGKPAAIDRATEFAVDGVVRVKAGGTITAGDNLTTTAAGLAETATSGDYIIGKAMEGGVSGDIIPMLITRWGVTT